ncbi:plasmid protein [Arthrobacter crystallopoietes BAB-32]|uniref:Plasmid protein n=1 Tax=Arthrobacter crystallopoietes BAB-32 TaxID=1246476 RepID=N1V4W2_9MICC|nr:AbrB/MazE/SpoVT family DNA-binding domain-containing protein [Arthrobacter crystallopoietes]EMY35059.1 plasmid protein [Arthrobacter crystallopoietes BAB-32]
MIRAKLFRSNRSQAVRLPKALEMPASVDEVAIVAQGSSRILSPVDMVWDAWFDGPAVTADFLAKRDQPQDQEREEI